METAKKPESLVAGGALITALTTAVYLNKQQNAISTQVDEVKDHLSSTISELKQEHDKLEKHEKHISTLAEGVRQLNALKIQQTEMFDYFYQVLIDRGKVIEALVESVAEMQAVMVENGTQFKNGSIRDVVDFSEQESLSELSNGVKMNDMEQSRHIDKSNRYSRSRIQQSGPHQSTIPQSHQNHQNPQNHQNSQTTSYIEGDGNIPSNINSRTSYRREPVRNNHNLNQQQSMKKSRMDMDLFDRNGSNMSNNGIASRSNDLDLPSDDFDDSEDEIEAQMRAMRERRGNSLSMG